LLDPIPTLAQDLDITAIPNIKDKRKREEAVNEALGSQLNSELTLESQSLYKVSELGSDYSELVFRKTGARMQAEWFQRLAYLDEGQPDMRDVYSTLNFDGRGEGRGPVLESIAVHKGKIDSALDYSEVHRDNGMLASMLYQRLNKFSNIDLLPSQGSTLAHAKVLAKKLSATIAIYSVSPSLGTGSPIRECHNQVELYYYEKSVICQLNVWIVRPSGSMHFFNRNIDLRELNSIVREIESFSNFDKAQSQLTYLSSVLVRPIENYIPSNPAESNMIFVVPTELTSIPFSALKDSSNTFLISRTSIAMAPSIGVLREVSNRDAGKRQKTNDAVLFGNPTMPNLVRARVGRSVRYESSDRSDFEPLPGAEEEVVAISKIIKAKVYLGSSASPQNLLMELSKGSLITHVATHMLDDYFGIGGAGYPTGAIVLAASPQNPSGLITGAELTGMDRDRDESANRFILPINSSLVVLSGCNSSAGGTGPRGTGLARAFITGGSSSVISSLRPIYDQTTADLMVELYTNLVQGRLSAGQALRKAIVVMIEKKEPVSSWGPFILTGLP
jgi:CHAT domain-containing protein